MSIPTPDDLLRLGVHGYFGCAENEYTARRIVIYLTVHGNDWLTPFRLEKAAVGCVVSHTHSSCDDNEPDYECSIHRFLKEVQPGLHRVTAEFLERAFTPEGGWEHCLRVLERKANEALRD